MAGESARTESAIGTDATRNEERSPEPGDRLNPNIGQLLLGSWELFADRIVSGIHEHGFEDFRLADTAVLRYMDPEGSRITTIAERARMTKQAISQLVQRLEKRGYVVRESDPDDGRAKLVQLSDRGRSVIEAAQETYRELESDWKACVGEEDLAQVERVLTNLLDAHDALPRFQDPLEW